MKKDAPWHRMGRVVPRARPACCSWDSKKTGGWNTVGEDWEGETAVRCWVMRSRVQIQKTGLHYHDE